MALRILRLLVRRDVVPSVVSDYGMDPRDAEVVVAAACLLHDSGMSIHRNDHEAYSLFLAADKLGSLLANAYREPERSVIVAEAMHAIIGHRRRGEPITLEAGVVRVADTTVALQQLARTRVVLAEWQGGVEGGRLTYAKPGHAEYRSWPLPAAPVLQLSPAPGGLPRALP